jgi:hypothetical protein
MAKTARATTTLDHLHRCVDCCQEDDRWAIDALGAPYVGERYEKALISSLVDDLFLAVLIV